MRGERRKVHAFGFANLDDERPMRGDDRMSGATALSLVSKGALSLDDTIGDLPARPAHGLARTDP